MFLKFKSQILTIDKYMTLLLCDVTSITILGYFTHHKIQIKITGLNRVCVVSYLVHGLFLICSPAGTIGRKGQLVAFYK